MSQNNLPQGYNWESQCEDAQGEFSRAIQDEVISVYEVYVKEEETCGSDGRSDGSAVSGNSGSTTSTSSNCTSNANEHQLIQRAIFKGDCMNLDAAIESEIINADGSVAKLIGKESLKYKLLEQSISGEDDDIEAFPNQTVSELQNGNPGPRLVDKDDPRSRLHFVKYLKRDGKTLKIWECGICTKEFRHQYTLMRHLPTHTDERNFKCDACGKAFRQLSTLSQHKAIHSDARPYVCEFCKKTFNRVSTLISHRKTHSEHKPHKCHLCGKGFHQKGNLRNHVFTHTNERPYKCELCGKGFNQMSNLVCHKVKAHAHSEKMQYSCGICGMEFQRRFALRSHEEYKHGIKYRNPSGIQNEQTTTGNSTSTSAAASNTSRKGSASPSNSTAATITGPNVMRNKNVRIVELPNGDRNQEVEIRTGQMEYTESIVIDKIDTKALENAVIQGQTPFALLKPVKGIPVLVKVAPAGPHKHLLTPVTAEDLRMVGKMTLSPTLTADPDGSKAVQVKVPVVATVTQHVGEDGKQSFTVEVPGPDQDLENLVAPLDCHFPFQDTESTLRLESPNISLFDRPNNSEINTLPVTDPQPDDCNELLELAAQGGIQFVRATEDGRYEVMTNSEARDLMAQNSHDVTILDGDDADALNIVNSRGQSLPVEESMMDNPENQIMVLDAFSNDQKPMNLDGIEILEDKDIKIIDPKNIDERMIDGMAFLSQMKIDDMILVPGKSSSSLENALGCPISVGSPSSSHDYSGILGSRNDLTGFVNNTQSMSMTSLLTKSQQQHQPSSLSILNDTMNYLRNCPPRSLSDEFNMMNEENEALVGELEERHLQQQQGFSCYGASEDPLNILAIEQQEAQFHSQSQNHKILGHQISQNCHRITDYYRDNEARNYWDNQRNLPSFGEVKILGSKNPDSLDNSSIQLQDIRILGSYEQFFKSSASFGQQQFGNSIDENLQSNRKQVKILGKKLESGFLESNEDGTMVKIEETSESCRKMVNVLPRDPSVKSTPVSVSPEEHRSKGSTDFLLQTCSPDFFNLQKHQRELESPERLDFDEACKEQNSSADGLPYLD